MESSKFGTQKRDFRIIFLYEFKLCRNATGAVRKINRTFGPGTANDWTIQCSFENFHNGDEELQDEPRTERPGVIDNEVLKSMVEVDLRLTVWVTLPHPPYSPTDYHF